MADAVNQKDHPRLRASFLSTIFYLFTFDTFRRGYKREWNSKNIYSTIAKYKSQVLGDQIDSRWTKYREKSANEKGKPNILLHIIFNMFWPELLFSALLLALSQIVLRLAEPILLGHLLQYFKEEDSMNKSEALSYGFYITGVIGARIVLYNQYKMRTYSTVLKTKVACSALIFRKVLKLSLFELQDTTTGRIVNMMSYDLNRLDFGMDLIHFIWVAPIFVLSIIYILYVETGISGIVGVLWFSFLAIVQSYNGNLTASIYGRMNRKSINRIRIMNEIISGIQVIKMYAWEKSFSKLIRNARFQELRAVTHLNYARNLYLSFSSISNHLALFLTITVLISMKENITSAKVYGLVVYYGILNFIVSIMFVLAISKTVEVWKIFQRINTFLLKEEFQQIQSTDIRNNTIIKLDEIEARWNSSTTSLYNNNKLLINKKTHEKESLMNKMRTKVVLQNITLAINNGNLVGIVGSVGSGKSSLLQTLLGELELTSGTLKVQKSLSYASQDAWLFAGTIRENILFGEDYEEERYKEVGRVCCLERDFELFPNRDLTIVGDRGASLSGGQKSRINLARAVYRQRNIYLLDDPLSAVDVQVAKHIYHECIEKFLSNKCRILVTHHIQHLKTVDYIIVLNQGTIQDSGTFTELIRRRSILDTKRKDTSTMQECQQTMQDESQSQDDIENTEDEISNDLEPEDEIPTTTEAKEFKKEKLFFMLRQFLGEMNWCFFIFVFSIFTLIQVLLTTTDFFLSSWVNVEEHRNNNITGIEEFKIFKASFPVFPSKEYLFIYGGLIALVSFSHVTKSILYVNFSKSNSKKLHDNIFDKVMNASMEFFDNTSSGQILTRFSRDLQAADEFIPRTIMEALMFVNSLSATVLIVLILNPYIVIMVIIMSICFILFSYLYIKTSRNIKEVESSLMSPILSHLNETMQGIITIRGLNARKTVQRKFNDLSDSFTSSWYMLATVFATFGFYIEFISFTFISVVTMSLILMGKDFGLTASEAGLAITQSMILSAVVQYGVLNCAQLGYLLVSIGRILEYNLIPQEEEPVKPITPPTSWPKNGKITFRNVNVRYSSSKRPALRNLSFEVQPGEKIGIVGRTGAGKSSLLSALFRLTKLDGTIEIDSLNTSELSLQTLRSKLSIIPQDPVLFNGTLRFNLDPFEEYDDHTLYEALKSVELNNADGQTRRLSAKVRDRGSNYSVGQRQLICLARAIIRRNRIVILDEATANVDAQTDIKIQKTMKKQFSNCTVLTVAHRLSTVINSDKIMVIDSGELVESGHPYILLNNTKSKFYSMVSQSGPSTTEQLKKLALKYYQEKTAVQS